GRMANRRPERLSMKMWPIVATTTSITISRRWSTPTPRACARPLSLRTSRSSFAWMACQGSSINHSKPSSQNGYAAGRQALDSFALLTGLRTSLSGRLLIGVKELIPPGQHCGSAHTEGQHNDNPDGQPGGVEQADQVKRSGWQGDELEVNDDGQQDKRDRWQDHMPPNPELCAMFTPVEERHRQAGSHIDEQNWHSEQGADECEAGGRSKGETSPDREDSSHDDHKGNRQPGG